MAIAKKIPATAPELATAAAQVMPTKPAPALASAKPEGPAKPKAALAKLPAVKAPAGKAVIKTAAAKKAIVKKAVVKKASAKAPLAKAIVPAKSETVALPPKTKKPKLVRDSFTIPKTEYLVLDDLKQRAAKLTRPAKKSELLRAAIKTLAALSDAGFLTALAQVPTIKTGRPTLKK